ncbi:cytochrome P450 76C1-like [Rutidosis leptorrhynchoides]|uniref:cytochrome P450 76C1-like n=1 Tax=Rutidosis leptorrhynchoides TaxID=125765 RepID=UPI003A99B61F
MVQLNDTNELISMAVAPISIVILLTILWLYKLTLSSSKSSLPPGPRSLPIVGYLPFLRRDFHKQIVDMAYTYGPIFKFHLGSKLYVVINTPELVKEVVRDQDEVFSNHDVTVSASMISYGCQDLAYTGNNSKWRNLRKIFVHELLSNKNLEASGSFRSDEIRKTIKHVYCNIGKEVNISDIAFLTEMNVLTSMVWENTSIKGAKGIQFLQDLQTLTSNLVDIVGQPNLSDFFPSLAWFDLQGIERKMNKTIGKIDQILTNIIEDRVKSNSKKSEDGDGNEGKKKKDFLQILLDLKDQNNTLNITNIKALLMDTMLGGTETTATLIEWAMAEIMKNYKVMKLVQEELTKVVGTNNIVEESHIPQLEYLHATINETYRLHPVLPFLLPRTPSKDSKVGGYTVPKGCCVFLNAYSIHRDPRYWDNPLEFNPERFLKDKCNYNNGNNFKFFPFGSGRRICVGIPLVEKMTMLILASLLHSFDWSLPQGIEEHDLSEKMAITLKKIKPLLAIPSQRLLDASLYN